VLADNQEDWRVVRIVCAVFVAASMTLMAMAPAAAARSCYEDWDGQSSFVVCSEAEAGVSGSPWTWAFVSGWASMVALLLLTERCARRKELEASLSGGVSSFPGSSRQAS
jgi:hypothetical protein